MRIAIVNITGGNMSGGYKIYLKNIIPRMVLNKSIEEILCASPYTINIEDWIAPLTGVKHMKFRPYVFFPYDSNILNDIKKFSPDVIFIPVARIIRFNNIPVVNMIQNMSPFVKNADGVCLLHKAKSSAHKIIAKAALNKADRVIAISKFVFNYLADCCNVPVNKIGLVYHGIENNKHEDSKCPVIIPEKWRDKFLFTAGSIRPARGLEDIFYALKRISTTGNKLIKLVIAGDVTKGTENYKEALKDWADKNNLSNSICWAGLLNKKEMAWCYRNCQAFIMSSRVESFGMIAGEAMSSGSIIISANSPCLPEIFEDAAIYYPSGNPDKLAVAIIDVLTLDKNRMKYKIMTKKAKKRALTFSWDDCAKKTVVELRKAVEDYK
jgi:glycosyltransferase involved in cell wall biosynthesis